MGKMRSTLPSGKLIMLTQGEILHLTILSRLSPHHRITTCAWHYPHSLEHELVLLFSQSSCTLVKRICSSNSWANRSKERKKGADSRIGSRLHSPPQAQQRGPWQRLGRNSSDQPPRVNGGVALQSLSRSFCEHFPPKKEGQKGWNVRKAEQEGHRALVASESWPLCMNVPAFKI